MILDPLCGSGSTSVRIKLPGLTSPPGRLHGLENEVCYMCVCVNVVGGVCACVRARRVTGKRVYPAAMATPHSSLGQITTSKGCVRVCVRERERICEEGI